MKRVRKEAKEKESEKEGERKRDRMGKRDRNGKREKEITFKTSSIKLKSLRRGFPPQLTKAL